jgi:hypothetical protein
MTAETRTTPIGPVLAIVGGVLLAIGSFLTWVTVDVRAQDVSDSGTGIDVDDGWITLVLGVVLVVAGVINLRSSRRALAVVAIVLGVLGLALGVWEIVTVEERALDAFAEELAPQFGISTGEFRALLDVAVEQGEVDISGGIGLYLVLAGSVLGVVGGALQLSSTRSTASAVFGTESVSSMTTPTSPARDDFPPPASAPAPTSRPPDDPSV